MEKTAMEDIIRKHNEVVKFFDTVEDVMIPANALMRLMPLSCKLASLGLAIVHEARAMGIDVKCNMQSGEIV